MSTLTHGQNAFAVELARLTGLNPNVIRGWTLAEESGSAAAQRQAQNNHNWLNIAYFDSGPGAITHQAVWSDPIKAAQASAAFLQGKQWGAAPGIRAILSTAGQSPEAQLRAIWSSPWASSHYGNGRDLQGTYKMFANMPTAPVASSPTPAAAVAPAPAVSTSAPTTGTTQPDPKATLALQLIRSNAKLAGIPSINFTVPQIGTTVQTNSVKAARVASTPAGQAALGSSIGNAVVKAAKQFLGVPYVWGGTTPKGFDCSGLMQYVFHKFGINIPRVTYDQVKAGKAVPRSALQPGDLIFFGTWNDPHHVGMFVGNGQFIEAPHTGDVVKISNLAGRSDYLTARRFARA